jgi:PII-like signaling protein
VLSDEDEHSLRLPSKKKVKLTVTVRATDSFHGKRISNLLFDLLKEKGFEAVVMVQAAKGYDQRGFATSTVLGLSMKVPVTIETVEESGKILALLPRIKEIVGAQGLITTCDVDVY